MLDVPTARHDCERQRTDRTAPVALASPPPPPAPTGPGPARAGRSSRSCASRSSSSGCRVLAFVSWIFGIMMAVASDLPQLEDRAQFADAAELGRLRHQRQEDRDPDQQRGPDPHQLGRHRAGDEGGHGRDRGPALLRAPRRRLPGHRPRGGPGRPPHGRRPRAPRRSPSSSSRTRCAPRAAGPSSRSSARPRSPTSSSATGTRTRSSPST